MGGSDITLRAAQDKDAPALAELAIMAAHGVMNLLYEGLIPGHSVAEAIIERRLRNPARFCAIRHWCVAEDAQGQVLGGLNSLPNVELAKSVNDPAIGPDRLEPLTKLFELDPFLADTYYVNMIAVFPHTAAAARGAR